MKKINLKKILLVLLCTGCSFCVYATELEASYSPPGWVAYAKNARFATTENIETDREAIALTRIYTLLTQLTPLINEAKRYQTTQNRVQFCYEALQQDIDDIKFGIDAKFHPQSIEPRTILPIQGDYLHFTRKSK